MDANGQRFWMWSQPADWSALDGCGIASVAHGVLDDGEVQAVHRPLLSLRAERAAPPQREGVDRALRAETELAMLPLLRDRFGTFARWDSATNCLLGYGAFDGEVPRYATSAAGAPLDMALDADQVLLLAFADRIEMVDLRDRCAPIRLALPLLDGGESFVPHGLACDAHGGRWALDRTHRRVARIAGAPWPDRAAVTFDAGTFRPAPENTDAPRLELLPVALPAVLRPVALAASAIGRLAIAGWGSDGALTLMLIAPNGASVQASAVLAGAAYAHALAWLDEAHVALRISDLAEVLAYAADAGLQTDADGVLQPVGLRYPSADAASGRFVATQAWPPHLALAPPGAPVGDAGAPRFSRPLVPLAWRSSPTAARTAGRSTAARSTCAGIASTSRR